MRTLLGALAAVVFAFAPAGAHQIRPLGPHELILLAVQVALGICQQRLHLAVLAGDAGEREA